MTPITLEQIGLLEKICESLKMGTFVQDMRVVLGVTTDPPLTVAYGAESSQQVGGVSKTTLGYHYTP